MTAVDDSWGMVQVLEKLANSTFVRLLRKFQYATGLGGSHGFISVS
jgi:hypothetical protein